MDNIHSNYLDSPDSVEISIADNYAIRAGLNYTIYRVMFYGNKQQKIQLKLSILKTYIYRFLILFMLLFTILVLILVYHNNTIIFYHYLLPLFIILGIIMAIQGWYLVHSLRSIKNQPSYIRLNHSTIAKFQSQESYERGNQLTTNLVSYEFIPPPNYREANISPPAYQQN
ncbi:hypothetical protein K502DRAFT_364903 [Neoconidiobolus thromboides FSU 785]|nr:hypothetical protein K502DRAFT_364903 [Neoconidiobolus thromboides FSU 785]